VKREHILLLLGSMAAGITIVAVVARRSSHPEHVPVVEAQATSTSTAPRFVAPQMNDAAVTSVVGESRAEVLRRDLANESVAVRIAAIERAVSATAIEVLPVLEDVDLKRDPDAAPTVIHAVALLGASADDRTRDHAARTLASWLRTEKTRDGLDALGNVSNLVEALGNVGGGDAVDALTAALDRGDLALHVETLATMKLGELADRRARGAVERFAARVAALPPADGLDEELRVEAIAAARTTLAALS
jgi:hypothetical protein